MAEGEGEVVSWSLILSQRQELFLLTPVLIRARAGCGSFDQVVLSESIFLSTLDLSSNFAILELTGE